MIKVHHVFFNVSVLFPPPPPSSRFDGVDTMAEHDEFLPHKDGVKKEIHFTDVSAFKLRRTSENVEVPDWFAVSQMGGGGEI